MLREKTGATPGISQETENKETETQKTNSIPFAKPIRRPMQLEGNHIAKEIKIVFTLRTRQHQLMVATDFSLVPRTVAGNPQK